MGNDNVHPLPPGVKYRECPGCGYLMSQIEVDAHRENRLCPSCLCYYLSDFTYKEEA